MSRNEIIMAHKQHPFVPAKIPLQRSLSPHTKIADLMETLLSPGFHPQTGRNCCMWMQIRIFPHPALTPDQKPFSWRPHCISMQPASPPPDTRENQQWQQGG